MQTEWGEQRTHRIVRLWTQQRGQGCNHTIIGERHDELHLMINKPSEIDNQQYEREFKRLTTIRCLVRATASKDDLTLDILKSCGNWHYESTTQ